MRKADKGKIKNVMCGEFYSYETNACRLLDADGERCYGFSPWVHPDDWLKTQDRDRKDYKVWEEKINRRKEQHTGQGKATTTVGAAETTEIAKS